MSLSYAAEAPSQPVGGFSCRLLRSELGMPNGDISDQIHNSLCNLDLDHVNSEHPLISKYLLWK